MSGMFLLAALKCRWVGDCVGSSCWLRSSAYGWEDCNTCSTGGAHVNRKGAVCTCCVARQVGRGKQGVAVMKRRLDRSCVVMLASSLQAGTLLCRYYASLPPACLPVFLPAWRASLPACLPACLLKRLLTSNVLLPRLLPLLAAAGWRACCSRWVCACASTRPAWAASKHGANCSRLSCSFP